MASRTGKDDKGGAEGVPRSFSLAHYIHMDEGLPVCTKAFQSWDQRRSSN